ncbi:hypothetical protein FB558_3758 [Pseudonocardia kunmingensis]|uniref:Uncharacterized protein n=1 Tax=Pseudonocardia kunmingensis TaxID=630975 RepID=A0A543DPE0_9PSEU|nr:hypothetical protein FB558_3758 [Pseudonocardia kunmingensis]
MSHRRSLLCRELPERRVGGALGPVVTEGDPLGRLHGEGGVGRDLLGERDSGVEHSGRRHDLVDQAQREGPRRVDRLAGEQQLEPDSVWQLGGQAEGSPGPRDEAAPHLRQSEGGGLGRDDEIAGQRDLGATAHGGAVDGGDRRLADVVADVPREAPPLPPFSLGDDPLAAHDRLEVGAGTEGLVACAGEHHRADVDVAIGLLHRVPDPEADRFVHGVAGFRAVDRDDQDMVAALHQHGFGGDRARLAHKDSSSAGQWSVGKPSPSKTKGYLIWLILLELIACAH